jgi:hypothetical protein
MNTILSVGFYVALAKIHAALPVQTYHSKHHILSHKTIVIVYQSVNDYGLLAAKIKGYLKKSSLNIK